MILPAFVAFLTLAGASTSPPRVVSDTQYRRLLSGLISASARYRSGQSDADFDACSDLGDRLYASSTAQRAMLLIAALGAKGLAKAYILKALGKAGGPAEVTPYFLKEVASTRAPDPMDGRSVAYVARQYVLQDRDPRAVDYLIAQLQNPRGDPMLREQAYYRLPVNGGIKGVRAVLAARRHTGSWTNAPESALDDSEQVLAAAFEGRFHFDNGVGPMIFEAPADMKPFAMPGRVGPTEWSSGTGKSHGRGAGYIGFDLLDKDPSKPWDQRLIRWNRDRSQAEMEIIVILGRRNGDGYHVTLKKLLGQWVVTGVVVTMRA